MGTVPWLATRAIRRATRNSAKKKKLSAVLANERSTDLDQDSEEHLEPKLMKDRSNKVQREQVV
ncbi:hypothetical protein H0G86_000314 [Trichoderma simmonsii]|uniref:Uncharacterized protein n=1 Tax=Trichoderma simmonsii TaxID=1491479 RepID=A0A8G0L2G1_9HYPO|nr:hypothetical protein H0G86_000314 [Trichoderma simmonsii]